MWFDSTIKAYRRWRAYRETVAELSALDNAELDDLGIGRWQIQEVARRALRG
ncbi:MAG: DUF1127 domain-containing protein [Kiloniellales bacterium]|nr:DUF1127 domain-containing protein [Kiloniellales bacterium]